MPPSTTLTPRRITGIAVGSAGAALLGIGIGFGVVAIRKKQASDALCDDTTCTAEGVALVDSGLTASHAATGLVVSGAALALTGLALALYPSHRGAPAPVVSATANGLFLGGTW